MEAQARTWKSVEALLAENRQLKATNAEMLKLLEQVRDCWERGSSRIPDREELDAAIARARGETP